MNIFSFKSIVIIIIVIIIFLYLYKNRSALFSIEKFMDFINKKFWDLMIYINILINSSYFQTILFIICFIVLCYYIYAVIITIY